MGGCSHTWPSQLALRASALVIRAMSCQLLRPGVKKPSSLIFLPCRHELPRTHLPPLCLLQHPFRVFTAPKPVAVMAVSMSLFVKTTQPQPTNISSTHILSLPLFLPTRYALAFFFYLLDTTCNKPINRIPPLFNSISFIAYGIMAASSSSDWPPPKPESITNPWIFPTAHHDYSFSIYSGPISNFKPGTYEPIYYRDGPKEFRRHSYHRLLPASSNSYSVLPLPIRTKYKPLGIGTLYFPARRYYWAAVEIQNVIHCPGVGFNVLRDGQDIECYATPRPALKDAEKGRYVEGDYLVEWFCGFREREEDDLEDKVEW
ncbi:hypothetical protein QBC38DRAFT_199671 [Podospora fimiseda]|uniref:Uncharacterized protein n=1 Tax=Podospora fimiseda TaxID=252190 RepID=A0AAN7BPK2_9PEZI|nr:hypothetical protein QBC38DRAFT_199671 [Podospora fimiseda]